ncbi:MAG: hydrogenase nickel incorporation protein HypB, partial [Cyanothece sp. SIO2G6]|nr:hydrogenase nickel incorporation protein HypB [Cyanothece sp. SIO2G6]
MCQDCGCAEVGTVEIHGMPDKHSASHQHLGHDQAHPPDHAHGHDHSHDHTHSLPPTHSHTLAVHERILSKNDRFAANNRAQFQQHGLLVMNMLSSPGAGKTSVIERMAQDFRTNDPVIRASSLELGVIVGDLATENDAVRLRQAGALALQITTGDACHLEADMVGQALSHFDLSQLDLLIIENVGNLVCPASYDLGEAVRVVLLALP